MNCGLGMLKRYVSLPKKYWMEAKLRSTILEKCSFVDARLDPVNTVLYLSNQRTNIILEAKTYDREDIRYP